MNQVDENVEVFFYIHLREHRLNLLYLFFTLKMMLMSQIMMKWWLRNEVADTIDGTHGKDRTHDLERKFMFLIKKINRSCWHNLSIKSIILLLYYMPSRSTSRTIFFYRMVIWWPILIIFKLKLNRFWTLAR